jgi:Flp pilus assembly pilin Flp
MRTLLAKFLTDRSGAAILEYSLIIGAVAVMLVSAVSSLGQGLGEIYQRVILALRSLN